jgi:predicted RNA-binding protein (virulence factor B family)
MESGDRSELILRRWGLSIGNFYKALGDLKNKGIVVEIASQLELQMEPS